MQALFFFIFFGENGYAKFTCTFMRGKSKSATITLFIFVRTEVEKKGEDYETDKT